MDPTSLARETGDRGSNLWARPPGLKISICSPLATFLHFGPLIFVHSDRRGHCPRYIKIMRVDNSHNSNKFSSKIFGVCGTFGVCPFNTPLKGVYPQQTDEYYGPRDPKKNLFYSGGIAPIWGRYRVSKNV